MKIIYKFEKMSDVGQMNEPWVDHKANTPSQPSNKYGFKLIRGMNDQINTQT